MKTLAIATLLLSGCFVVPKTSTTTKNAGTEEGALTYGAVNSITLKTSLDGAIVEVAATAERQCEKPIYQVIETKKEKHASYRPNKDARTGLFALVLAPVTIPVSALVTGLAVLADGDGETTSNHKLLRTEKVACTSPADNVTLAITMPSGQTVNDITDPEGIARVRIPDTEPYTGVVSISGPQRSAAQLRYTRAMPAVTRVRETVMTCSTVHHVRGSLKMQLDIDEDGKPTNISLDAGDGLFAACVNEGLANARFSEEHRSAKLVLPFTLPG